MDLFPADPSVNLLPCDGAVHDHGPVLSEATAEHYFQALLQRVPWRQDEAILYGKHIVTARKVAWYGDVDFPYTYSGVTRHALPWNPELLALKTLAEQHSGARFNSCLLNLYANGDEGMGWHSDDEKSLAFQSEIASLSLGAERRFCFKHKRLPLKAEAVLQHGALLVMKGATQSHWLHSLPKSAKVTQPRINLTFRRMVG